MSLFHLQQVGVHRQKITRRSFLHTLSAGAVATGMLNFRDVMCLQAEELRRQGKSLIVLWMQGGPSQLETFDPKPGHANGGPTKTIQTAVPGIEIASDWEQTAKAMGEIALIRSMTNREGNHQRATYQLHTGYVPSGSVKHPALGPNIAKVIADPELPLPAVVSIGAGAEGAGFLGVNYEPFVVQQAGEMPANLTGTVPEARFNRRVGLLNQLEEDFSLKGGQTVVDNHQRIYTKASRMSQSEGVKVFDLADEDAALKQQYGDNAFGRGCLLARRLVEAGTTYVEVRSNGWDSHNDNFTRVSTLSRQVDPGFGTLIADLKQRGRLENTLVVWMGEFGRTPRINGRTGRDHYPRAFSVAVAGCGVKGGQVLGATSADGMSVEDQPAQVGDLFASICHAMRVDPNHENISPLGRPMRIVDKGEVIPGLF